MHLVRLWLLALAACAVTASGAELARRTWTIDGTVREALVHLPAAQPLIFIPHGRDLAPLPRVFTKTATCRNHGRKKARKLSV